MDPITMAGVGSAAGLVGDIAGGILTKRSQKKANKTAKKIAREQMAFQERMVGQQHKFQTEANQKQMDFAERMANTAHQRQIEDLKKAGLNPILAAGGTGASAPQGSTSAGASASGASAPVITEDAFGQAIGNMAPRALANKQAMENIKLTEAQVNNTNAQKALTDQKAITEQQSREPNIELTKEQRNNLNQNQQIKSAVAEIGQLLGDVVKELKPKPNSVSKGFTNFAKGIGETSAKVVLAAEDAGESVGQATTDIKNIGAALNNNRVDKSQVSRDLKNWVNGNKTKSILQIFKDAIK